MNQRRMRSNPEFAHEGNAGVNLFHAIRALSPLLMCVSVCAAESRPALPVHVDAFDQQIHTAFTEADGLPSNDVRRIAIGADGVVFVDTSNGRARLNGGRWALFNGDAPFPPEVRVQADAFPELAATAGGAEAVRAITLYEGECAAATESGLYLRNGKDWTLALPRHGAVRWAPADVRAVAYDADGRLWFACPQGVGYRLNENEWCLFTGAEGLPFNDFTCMAAGPKGVWFGTTNGAIRFANNDFEYRQGRRWLVDNRVRGIAVAPDGSAWFATAGGVSRITFKETNLAEKAAFFESEIDRHHRRTRFGYVCPARLSAPGDKNSATTEATDNDGHFGGLYLAAASLGYAATKDPKLRADAARAFEALAFLSEVTKSGTHPAPRGFIARAIAPTSGPNPNELENEDYNRRRRDRDALWKLITPRWPVDATGEWYWKCDSSSDELDGHYFGFGVYYDRVCETEEERDAVRAVVRRITDHIVAHGFNLVDHDGKPTRWARFSPEELNGGIDWWVERGLNSASILTYLSVAHHITGDPKYRGVFLDLVGKHGYAMNLMSQPKAVLAPGAIGQADDNMAFMNYYHLVRYETDPKLLNMFQSAALYHWRVERYERNPFFNFAYAACCLGQTRKDAWGTQDLSPYGPWLDDSIDTLKRYPLDLVDWPMSNAHRTDMVPLGDHTRDPDGGHRGAGHRVDGHPFRIDENHAIYWGDDPWVLEHNTDGTRLREGVSFLLAYYLGLVHGFIAGPQGALPAHTSRSAPSGDISVEQP